MVGILCSLLFVGVALTYAFIQVIMTTKNQETSITTGTLSLTFEDGISSFQGELDFGSSVVKTFTIENTGTLDASAVMYFDNLTNTYTLGSLTYTLEYKETEDGEYTEIVPKSNVPRSETSTSRTLSTPLLIPSKQKYFYKLTITLNYLNDVDQTSDFNAIFSSNFRLEEKGNKALDTVYALGLKTKEGSPDFALAATTDETSNGLYAMEDDYGTSYHYRGTPTNNYVKFGDFYWRILRINGNGTLRIIYDGTYAHANGESSLDRVAVQNVVYNTNIDDAKYAGYMYGPAGTVSSISMAEAQSNIEDSTIKARLDKWYEDNIISNNLEIHLADSLFCNDRSKEYDDHPGYGMSNTYFGGRGRYRGKWAGQPTLKCPQKNDAFTATDTRYGNGDLKYPIGLLTKDEDLVAGTGTSKNTKYYLYKGYMYWTMTPDSYYSRAPRIMPANSWSSYYPSNYSSTHLVPVINLKADTILSMTGDGSKDRPYELSE